MNSIHSEGPQVSDTTPVVVIPRENAVFRLDGEGFWRNDGGKFRNRKIIDYFHRAISRDADGYFVWQDKGGVIEKVYFPYEDTALFVFDVIGDGRSVRLVLNTRREIRLQPEHLYIRGDNLYIDAGGEPVKFRTRALMKLSEHFEEGDDGTLFLRVAGRLHEIPEAQPEA